MSEREAIATAEAYVRTRGGQLNKEIRAWRRKRWFKPVYYWRIVSNIPRKGGNWFIELDDESGEVLNADVVRK